MGTNDDIESIASQYSASETMDRLESFAKSPELEIFGRLNFQTDAAKAGLAMPSAELLIFGNPKAGTPLMVAIPLIALDLPLKILVWEDETKKVWVSYNKPEYLQKRYGLSDQLLKNISGVKTLIEKALQ